MWNRIYLAENYKICFIGTELSFGNFKVNVIFYYLNYFEIRIFKNYSTHSKIFFPSIIRKITQTFQMLHEIKNAWSSAFMTRIETFYINSKKALLHPISIKKNPKTHKQTKKTNKQKTLT